MELIPKELEALIPTLYATEEMMEPIAYVKLFLDGWTWYITELSTDKDICFGYVVSPFGSELGYFSLEEIKSVRGALGLGVERDVSFQPTPLKTIRNKI